MSSRRRNGIQTKHQRTLS
ncbi:hypothetical protein [Flavobacterium sp.]